MNSPGVNMAEMDFSDYVQSASEVAVGCVGGARRGPLTPTLITSQEELIRIFGEPISNDYGIYGAYAALTQVTQLFYQRVVSSGTPAVSGQPGVNKLSFTMNSNDSSFNGYKAKITQEGKEEGDPIDGEFLITIVNSSDQEVEKFENLSSNSDDPNYISKIINTESILLSVVVNDTGALKVEDMIFSGGEAGSKLAYAGESDDEFIFRSKYPDSTINNCRILITDPDSFGYFDITLVSQTSDTIESFPNLTSDPEDERYAPRFINTYSNRIQASYNKEGTHKGSYVFLGGTDGISQIVDTDIIGNLADGSGIYGFNNPETVDINLLIVPGVTSDEVVSASTNLCESRGDCLYVIDPPFGLTAQKVKEWANGEGDYSGKYVLNSSYSALYWSWIYTYDVYSKDNIYLPPSGYVVAQMAYSDSQSYPWFAPAGLKRGIIKGILDIEVSPTQGERDAIYGNRNCVNPIVKFTGTGISIWGQKTTQRKCSALDRVNVRRLVNWLKKSIGLSSKYFVFDPNDQVTWDQWTDMVEEALNQVKDARGIYELKVVMDPTNADIENNAMPGTIKIKPTKSAEFIDIGFMIMPYSASFEEDIAEV